jgi:hypothetical protein
MQLPADAHGSWRELLGGATVTLDGPAPPAALGDGMEGTWLAERAR